MSRPRLSRRSFVTLAGAGSAAAAFGIPAYIPRIGEAADSIKIGLLEPYTGVYAGPAENETVGFELAVDAWNKRGGVLGRKLELVKEDEQNDTSIAAQKARKLINQDKVAALVGTVSSGVSLSVAGVATTTNTLFIDSGGHTDDVTGKNCHWSVFRTCHSTWMETHATGYALQKRFGKKWFLITPDYAYGHSLEAGFKDVLAHIGGSVVGNELTPLGTTDFSSYLTKIDGAKPDVVLVLVQGDDYTNCLKQMNQFGLLKKYPVGGPQVELEPLYGLPPEARGGYWGIEWYYKSDKTLGKNNKLAHEFVAEATKRHGGRPPTARTAFGYITLDRLAQAMNDAKSIEPVKVARAIEGTHFNSIFAGSAYYRKEDHQLMWPMWVAKIRPNGTPGDKYDLFDVTDVNAAEAVEQTIAQKQAVCKLGIPADLGVIEHLGPQLFNGIVLGAFYAIVALGLSLIMNLTGTINMAHGSFMTLAGYLAYTMVLRNVPFGWALVLAPLFAVFVGVVVERLLVRPLYKREPFYSLLMTFGLSLIAEEVFRLIWGPNGVPFSPPASLAGAANIGFMHFPTFRIFIVGVLVIAIAALALFLTRTRFGLRLRAAVQDNEMIAALGTNTQLLYAVNFSLGIFLAGIAGVLAAGLLGLTPTSGNALLMPAFVTVIIGGMGSLFGSIVGGLLVGIAISMTTLFIPAASEVSMYVLMAIVLLVRPRGLFGEEGIFG